MIDSGENTLLNLGQSPEGGDSADVGSGEYYKNAVRGGYDGTENEFDSLVERQYNGHYPSAIKGLGFVEKTKIKSPVEVVDTSEVPTSDDPKRATLLAQRAFYLSEALDAYLAASRAAGKDRVDFVEGDPTGKQKSHRHTGDVMFHVAYDAQKMVNNGEDPILAAYDEQLQSNLFYDSFTGPKNKKARIEFRKNLDRQKK